MRWDSRALYALIEPIHLVCYFRDEPTNELLGLGLRNYWDGYFAARAAPLGASAPAEMVHAIFYNFADGEVARHIPRVWSITTPEQALAARERGAVRALRAIFGDLSDRPELARASDLLKQAATTAPTEGRPLYAALRTVPIPTDPVARLWHAATMLRERRGDGHIAALGVAGVGGLESHALHAVSQGMPAEEFGRIHHLPTQTLARVAEGMRDHGWIDGHGVITALGRDVKATVEANTDAMDEASYTGLTEAERDELATLLGPIAAKLDEGGIPAPVV